MFRLWVRQWRDNHLVRDTVIEDPSDDTRTHKVFRALEQVRDFQRHSRARFTKDAFMEEIDFDYLEIYVIEEDDFIL